MNRLLTLGALIVFSACNTQPKTEQAKIQTVKLETTTIAADCTGVPTTACAGCPEAKGGKTLVVSVDSVQKNPEKYFDKSIALKGRVVHTCKEGGKKMFVTGSDENQLIRVNAGGNISHFDDSLEGEIVIAMGILTPVVDETVAKDSTGKVACVTEGKAKQYVLACTTFEVEAKK